MKLSCNFFASVLEAINNTRKHARAKTVKLHIRIQSNTLILRIQDDGQGFNANSLKPGKNMRYGLGLTNMRERALALGGTCEIKSQPAIRN